MILTTTLPAEVCRLYKIDNRNQEILELQNDIATLQGCADTWQMIFTLLMMFFKA